MPTNTRRRVDRELWPGAVAEPEARSTETFSSLAQNEHDANHWCEGLLHAWSLDPLRHQVVAVMDELLSNARRHGKGAVQVDVQQRGRRLRISVRDDGPGPMRGDGSGFPPQNAAHGLGRIAQVSHFWGVSRHPEGGTTVWSELDITGSPPL